MTRVIFFIICLLALSFTAQDKNPKKNNSGAGKCKGMKSCSVCTTCSKNKQCKDGRVCGVCSQKQVEEKNIPTDRPKIWPPVKRELRSDGKSALKKTD
jgi:hypothetical protein